MSTYACADLHGCWNLWEQIKKFCKEDDTIYILGDCIDRGPDGFGILQDVLNDPRVIMLCGNHEDMMADALEEEKDWGMGDSCMWMWFNNGGCVTYDSWQEAGRDFSWIEKIRALPTHATYTNKDGIKILMSHSGVVPKDGWELGDCGRKALLWDRDCIRAKHWHRADNEIVVHGHTTSIHLLEKLNILEESDILNPLIIKYCEKHKIDIDLCSHYTGICTLIDLDSLQPIYFNLEGKINETRSLEVDSRIRKLVSSF